MARYTADIARLDSEASSKREDDTRARTSAQSRSARRVEKEWKILQTEVIGAALQGNATISLRPPSDDLQTRLERLGFHLTDILRVQPPHSIAQEGTKSYLAEFVNDGLWMAKKDVETCKKLTQEHQRTAHEKAAIEAKIESLRLTIERKYEGESETFDELLASHLYGPLHDKQIERYLTLGQDVEELSEKIDELESTITDLAMPTPGNLTGTRALNIRWTTSAFESQAPDMIDCNPEVLGWLMSERFQCFLAEVDDIIRTESRKGNRSAVVKIQATAYSSSEGPSWRINGSSSRWAPNPDVAASTLTSLGYAVKRHDASDVSCLLNISWG